MSPTRQTPEAPEKVLATMNQDGSRKWLAPKLADGYYHKRRRVLAWLLMVLFVGLPHLSINGKPAVLLDLPAREFSLFGTTFLATDTVLLMLLMMSIFVLVFLLTAKFGRVWCGWACPQTVYLDFLFRPIERAILGRHYRHQKSRTTGRHFVLYGVFLVISLYLSHAFLAYFVGIERIEEWVTRSPFEHPATFAVMAVTSALVFADFAWFREQTCLVACPYGRFQSVLLDRQSLIVGYDEERGEPRGKARDPDAGDCVDCKACVVACPTGIDIRQGLQMECIACTSCIDACDSIMSQLGRPERLIRFTTQDEQEGGEKRAFRPRVVIYSIVLTILVGALLLVGFTRSDADITFLRERGEPYTQMDNGEVRNDLLVKIVNRTEAPRIYEITLSGVEGARLVSGDLPLELGPGESGTAYMLVFTPPDVYEDGRLDVDFLVRDDGEMEEEVGYRLLGPKDGGP